ncbi:hypothetical protein OEZ86_013451 [Tetradesmus obliquus]|nr:hypothetical protein OEZ86_013451 [Tetradesmus obliquus]
MCDYSCMTNFLSSVKTRNATKGVLEVDVKFKPLAGITGDMLVWLFNNDHKNTTYKAVDNTTHTMPMHLLFHPVDHVFHTASTSPVKVGTKLVWCEIPLSGCKHNASSRTQPWVCPSNRKGSLRSDPVTSWAGNMRSKTEMTVTVFNSSMMEFVAQQSHPLFGGDGKRVVGTTRHTWSDSPAGLQLRTQMFLGLMARGARDKFDLSLLAAPVNAVIKQVYLDNSKNIPAGNITAAGHMATLHFIQEYGSLPKWLPQVYKNRQQ